MTEAHPEITLISKIANRIIFFILNSLCEYSRTCIWSKIFWSCPVETRNGIKIHNFYQIRSGIVRNPKCARLIIAVIA